MLAPRTSLSLLCCFAVVALLPAQSRPAAPSAPDAVLRPLRDAVRTLASLGWRDEATLLLRELTELGLDPKSAEQLRAAIDGPAAKVGAPKPVPKSLLTTLQQSVAVLQERLDALQGEDRRRLAASILALDADAGKAHAVFGREREGGTWRDATARANATRRRDIDAAVARAWRLEFPITATPTTHPLMTAVGIAQPTEVKLGEMTVVTEWPPAKAQRAVRTFAQGAAMSRWLLTGELAFTPRPCRYLHFAQRVKYEAAVAELHRQGTIDAAEAAAVKPLHAFDPPGGFRFEQDITEGAFATALLYDDCYYRIPQAWLLGGHVDWIGRAVIGTPLGQYAFTEKARTVAGGTDPDWSKERFAKAGLAGARIWMRHLAAQRQDPPWSRAFLPSVGMIPFAELIKCTLVHEWLIERGMFTPLVAGPKDPAPFRDAVGSTTGTGFEHFDEQWRQWLVGVPTRGLLQRLATADPELATADEAKALTYLQQLRDQALSRQPRTREPSPPTVGFDRTLSDGCRQHARYLQQNRDQLAAWPDAHEEYPDRPGFTPGGAFAGTHSVITQAADMIAAIDGWMGTFYHRVPLIDPGLLSVGFALDGGIAVLDAGSLCLPSDTSFLTSMWPPPDGKNVPLRFHPEMPNPVPGEDQGRWGYPVTFQHHLPDPYDPASVVMTLHQGDAEAATVDCWFSSPVAPTNGEIAPADVYCLIPKQALLAKTRYTVVVRRPQGLLAQWSFTTR